VAKTRIPEILTKYQDELLADWVRMQLAAPNRRPDLISEQELRRESREFLDSFRQAARDGDVGDVSAGPWNKVRETLAGLSRSRARLGFNPADGLGHGLEAAEAAIQAVETFESTSALAPAAILELLHPVLRHTRGAAVAVADIDLDQRVLRFAGLGNISGGVFSARHSHQMVSHNGTLGHEVRKIQEFRYPWPERGLLIMHSDGLSRRSDPHSYPGLPARHPGLIAGVLYRDLRRADDDAAIVAVKDMGEA